MMKVGLIMRSIRAKMVVIVNKTIYFGRGGGSGGRGGISLDIKGYG